MIKSTIALYLHRAGFTADFLTYCGLFLACLSGVAAASGRFALSGLLLLASGGLDLLDGALARVSGKVTAFGGILDSTLDRYGDAAVLFGVLYWCAVRGHWTFALLAMSAIVGSFSISYVRARAECEIEECRVGYWERGERLVYLALGLISANLPAALWVLGTFTHATVIYRLLYAKNPEAWRARRAGRAATAFFTDTSRRKPYYLVKSAVFLALLAFWRPGF